MFKDLDRLLTIKKHGSFSKAADELYISRSALTQQMKQMELELGFSIFTRDHKGVHLTNEGAFFLDEMQEMKTQYRSVLQHCRQMQHMTCDTIVIGVMPNLRSPFLSGVCKEFCRQYPRVEVKFRDYFPKDYLSKLQAKDFDITVEYFSNYIHDIAGLQTDELMTTSHSLQVVPGHPLATKSTIGFEDLRGHKLIMYRRGITKSEDALRDYLLKHEPDIRILDIESYDSSLFTTCELEDAVLLSYTLYDANFPQFIHIPANWNIPIHLGFCHHKNCRPVVSDFVAIAKEVCSTNQI